MHEKRNEEVNVPPWYKSSSTVTKTSAEIDSLQYRRGCALQKIPKKAPLEVYEW